MSYEDSVVELLRRWVASLLSALDAEGDRDMQARLLEACGAACAIHHGDLERVKNLSQCFPDFDVLLSELNQQASWCGAWRKENDSIVSVCERCGCPLVREGLVELIPAFCECSRGFVKALFETVLGQSVRVSLQQAIGRGDPVCRFVVRYRNVEPLPCAEEPVSTKGRDE
jgi:predicted hydrocarbon binding protein